jgi:nucleoside-diphosphate-sugar epimerase
MAKVLICGGAGFIGSATAIELLREGHAVYVYDNLSNGRRSNLPGEVTVYPFDVLDEWNLLKCVDEVNPDSVINFTGDTFIPNSYVVPKRFINNNVVGAYNVLKACRNVKRIVHISTAEVYGNNPNVSLSETSPLSFCNTYATTKIAGDGLCISAYREHGTPVVVARLFNAYGPRESAPYVIAEIIKQLRDGPILKLGNIHAERDFTFVHDTARAIIALMEHGKPGEAYNIGSGVSYSIEYLYKTIAEIMDVEPFLQIDPARFRRSEIDRLVCDNAKLKQCTGWQPTVDIHDGLMRTVGWFRTNGSRWSWELKDEASANALVHF